jgi:uncharacterized iron-regulated membrane protein
MAIRELPPRTTVRRLLYRAHLLVGLLLGLWLVLVSLSGSLIVFRDEIEALLHRRLTRVEPGELRASLDSMLASARAGHPGATFHTVNLPRHPGESVSFWGHDSKDRSFHAYFHPATGAALGHDLAADNLTEWAYLFHAQLLGGGVGEQINGLGALVWLGLLGTGLALWWPRAGRPWRDGFSIRWQAGVRRRLYDWHRVAGIWSWVPLAVVIVTGISFPFQTPFRWLAETLTGGNATEDSPRSASATTDVRPVALDAALATARATLPAAHFNWLSLPEGSGDVISARGRLPGEWRREGANYVHMEPLSGAVLRTDLHTERTPAQRLLRSLFPWHAGTFGGTATRVLWVVLGWVPLLSFITGARMWWLRRARVSPPDAPAH